jgi:VIT1/CCC1 family predicted Fe2+/Mn2+ transporter
MPFRKRELFKETVGHFAKPSAIVVASLVGIISFGFYLIAEMFPIASGVFLGTNLMIAFAVVIVMAAIAFAVYASAAMKLRKVGLQISQIYSELPPE